MIKAKEAAEYAKARAIEAKTAAAKAAAKAAATASQRSSRRHYRRVATRTKPTTKPKRKVVKRKVYRTPKTGARYCLRKSKITGRMYKQYLPRK